MSAVERDKWNRRYETGAAPYAPSPFLVDCRDLLPERGRALDVAAGGGRHGLWLAERGFDVTLTDISQAGLAIAGERALACGANVDLVVRDLEADGLPTGPWSVIACFFYLERSLFPQFAAALAPGGVLIFVQPTTVNLERHSKPSRDYLLAPGELPRLVRQLAPDLAVVRYLEDWTTDGRHEARLIARKPPP